MTLTIRRVEAGDWRRVKELRLQAVSDPDAAIAFLSSYTETAAEDDDFWRARTENAATGAGAAQFVAIDGDTWIGTLTVLRRRSGSVDHHGRVLAEDRGDVVGVYVRPDHRGSGTIDALFDAAAAWSAGFGDRALTLDVHTDNARAQRAYERCGFHPSGLRFTGSIGPELEMVRELSDADGVRA